MHEGRLMVARIHQARRLPPLECLQHGEPQAEDVNGIVVISLPPDLGRYEGRRPEGLVRTAGAPLRLAKVADTSLGYTQREDEQIPGTDIPVHDAYGVQIAEPLEYLPEEDQSCSHGDLWPRRVIEVVPCIWHEEVHIFDFSCLFEARERVSVLTPGEQYRYNTHGVSGNAGGERKLPHRNSNIALSTVDCFASHYIPGSPMYADPNDAESPLGDCLVDDDVAD